MHSNMLGSYTFCFFVVIATATNLFRPDRKDYNGYKILEVLPETESQHNALRLIQENDQVYFRHKIQDLSNPSALTVGPEKYQDVVSEFEKLQLRHHTIEEDYGKVIDEELYRLRDRYTQDISQSAFNLTQWNTYEDIMVEIDNMAARCSASIVCTAEILGQSDSGRDIKILRISKAEADRQGVWIDSMIHANEWLSPSTMLYFFDFLTRSYDTDSVAQDLIDRFDWHYVPVMNPDGYVYSWEVDRDWRKSTNINSGSSCIGTDLNRNYDSNWMVSGASNDTCSRNYGGSGPASEVETQLIQSEIVRLAPKLAAFITVHIAAQMWLIPWGHTNSTGACVYAADHEELMRVVDLAADATQNTFGTDWPRGNTCETIYGFFTGLLQGLSMAVKTMNRGAAGITVLQRAIMGDPASGITSDFAYQSGITYSFTAELRGSDTSLTEDDIVPSYQEIRNGIVALLDGIDNPVR